MPPSLKTLSAKDIAFLKALDARIWDRHQDDLGRTHAFPIHGSQGITTEERERVLALVKAHGLPCVLTSGPYAELKVLVFGHTEYPEFPPERLIALATEHFGLDDALDWETEFTFMSAWTHTTRNRRVCKFYGLPAPESKDHYAY